MRRETDASFAPYFSSKVADLFQNPGHLGQGAVQWRVEVDGGFSRQHGRLTPFLDLERVDVD